jgi:folate-binding protein YgfZ
MSQNTESQNTESQNTGSQSTESQSTESQSTKSQSTETKSIELDHFGFLKVSGVDAVKFLQGYTTCDLAVLTDDAAQLGAVCNIQGRMIASFIVIRQGQDLVLRMHKSLISKTIAFLTKYIVFSKAELADISENLHCYGSPNTESTAGESPYPMKTDNGAITIELGNRQEQWAEHDQTPGSKGMIEQWTDAELDAGVAWVDEKSCEAYLPQTLNYHQLGGISFTKGCYLGQEIVARMQYRGALKKRLHQIESRAQGRDLTAGTIVVAGSRACLAVLSNPTADPIAVVWSDKTVDTASPLGAAANLEIAD